ncbi:hypothetical protein H2200_005198 [Cladophialophora chaetospira]|uniref:Prolyl 4-hydroxylase alpha subunit Fe(2+) 2OG dioxygenase domain-containing protein n=1 Tax=Cladophialophora chaetospira TaxID=386627 RepID=A0AA38XC49_9EURO|nr:hypothetical protein H2200_005198 [Cladophialophora chaetospira]
MRPPQTHEETSEDESESESSEEEPELPESEDVLKTDLLSAISAIEGTSSFACGAVVAETPNPALYVEGHGTIGLPLSENDAKVIISKSEQSPFGKGTQTIVDTSVRRSWQLDPSQFSLQNPRWTKTIEQIRRSVYEGLILKCGMENVDSQLYKLLLYEEGAFFKPHQDSEKAPGMFGTLMVCLPSAHLGGDLVLTHAGENWDFKTSTASPYDVYTIYMMPAHAAMTSLTFKLQLSSVHILKNL